VRYAFIAEHRDRFGVRAMCRCLAVQPSGFYAWQKNPLSHRAREDARQTELIRQAWNDSGKVYGYRKLHDDLLDHGETCCPNRVARLAKLAGIKAQIGYGRRPSSYGGKPSLVIDNTLDRQFDVAAPDQAWVTDITYIRTMEGFAYLAVALDLYSRRGGGLVDAEQANNRGRSSGPAHGSLAAQAQGPGVDPLGPRLAIHQYGLGRLHPSPQS
jgi:putative transposase